MTQRAKMKLFLDDMYAGYKCACGEEFFADHIEGENVEWVVDTWMPKCPGCGCIKASEEVIPVDTSAEDALRKSIGAKGREIIAATQRLRRRT